MSVDELCICTVRVIDAMTKLKYFLFLFSGCDQDYVIDLFGQGQIVVNVILNKNL